jgi:hypothetical protein
MRGVLVKESKIKIIVIIIIKTTLKKGKMMGTKVKMKISY